MGRWQSWLLLLLLNALLRAEAGSTIFKLGGRGRLQGPVALGLEVEAPVAPHAESLGLLLSLLLTDSQELVVLRGRS